MVRGPKKVENHWTTTK